MNILAKYISDQIEKILEDLGGTNYLVNPFFRISKATPIQMKKYQALKYKFPDIASKIILILSLPTIILRMILYYILSVLYSSQYVLFRNNFKSSDILFMSHATVSNLNSNTKDEFFAFMPKHYAKSKYNVSILYTNHHRFGFSNKSKKLTSITDSVKRNLIPKFLKPQEFKTYISTMIRLALDCLLLELRTKRKNPIHSALIFLAVKSFFSRQTYNNYLISLRVQDYFKSENVKAIYLTFEGHSYEQYLIDFIGSIRADINLVLYQHSPIVGDHFGVVAFLRTNQKNLKIYTTGITYRNYFRSISKVPKYEVIGSAKLFSVFYNKTDLKKKVVLLIPDGGEFMSTIKFLKLGRFLSSNNKDFTYILRIHPHLKKSLLIKLFLILLNNLDQVVISSDTLATDLKKSKFVIFRGSLVGIQALDYSTIQVFFGDPSQEGLNVLNISQARYLSAHNNNEVLRHVNSEKMQYNTLRNQKTRINMFEKIDYSKLQHFF